MYGNNEYSDLLRTGTSISWHRKRLFGVIFLALPASICIDGGLYSAAGEANTT